jgi:TonB-dependent receptor
MVQAIRVVGVLLLIGMLLPCAQAFAQGGVTVTGIVKDSQTGEPLPGANVVFVGTGSGSATDLSGRYAIRNVAAGQYSVKVSYVGYQTFETKLSVSGSTSTVTKDYKLLPVGVEGETIVVTAQAMGQNAAINQQLTSMPVMNVVSAAKIQELPDVNAAESVSRLPGVALIRTGGEGSQVIIRGLSPQYNQVTIDGVELPSDIPSGNNISSAGENSTSMGDRASDLSMISSSMLGGIEVIKAITPDMDATLLGGVVNFSMRKAAKSTPTLQRNASIVPLFELRTEGGYNALKYRRDDYKLIGSIENRFFDEALGVFLQGSLEKRNLSDNTMGASFGLDEKDNGWAGNPFVSGASASDHFRLRDRKGATVVIDYQHETGEIGFMNFYSKSNTRTQSRGYSVGLPLGGGSFSASDENNTINVFSNLISVKQDVPFFHIDGKFSHSFSESKNPEDLYFDWYDNQAILSPVDYLRANPQVTLNALRRRDTFARLNGMSTSGTHSTERAYAGALDLTTNISIVDGITAKLKFGGAMQSRTRYYMYESGGGNSYYSGGSGVVLAILKQYPWLGTPPGTAGSILASNFRDPNYKIGKFMSGDYPEPYPLNVNSMWLVMPVARATPTLEGYRKNPLSSTINNYDGNETKTAGYMMATFNVGDDISILPGVRYQNMSTEYTGFRGMQTSNGIQGKDTTVAVSRGFWLPMLHLRYTPTDWLQMHFAYTNTLTYPDYSQLTPRYLISVTGGISYNDWQLKPGRSENLDLVIAFHSNDIGLLSFNLFRKRIKDLIFNQVTSTKDLSKYPELAQYSGPLHGLSTYINNPATIDLYGLETEWQTHFWYLPGLLSGIVFDINYTHIFSDAKYPITIFYNNYDDEGNLIQRISDTTYSARMLNQPNDVLNISMGYDYEGFSARVSMLYQDNIFRNPDFWAQLWAISAKHTRWDISVKQELPWYNLQVYVNINNVTGEDDVTLNNKNEFPQAIEHYGMTASAGLRIRL